MTEQDPAESKLAELFETFGEVSMTPAPGLPLPPTLVIGDGATVVIGDNNHLGPKKSTPQPISEPQRRWLRDLVSRIAEQEQAANPAFSPAKVWTRLNAKMGVDSYKDIPRSKFDRARAYLEGWLNKPPKAPGPAKEPTSSPKKKRPAPPKNGKPTIPINPKKSR